MLRTLKMTINFQTNWVKFPVSIIENANVNFIRHSVGKC